MFRLLILHRKISNCTQIESSKWVHPAGPGEEVMQSKLWFRDVFSWILRGIYIVNPNFSCQFQISQMKILSSLQWIQNRVRKGAPPESRLATDPWRYKIEGCVTKFGEGAQVYRELQRNFPQKHNTCSTKITCARGGGGQGFPRPPGYGGGFSKSNPNHLYIQTSGGWGLHPPPATQNSWEGGRRSEPRHLDTFEVSSGSRGPKAQDPWKMNSPPTRKKPPRLRRRWFLVVTKFVGCAFWN